MNGLHKTSVIAILALCICIGSIAFWKAKSPGANLVATHPTDSLVGQGIWRFEYTIPAEYEAPYFVGLQIRRVKLDRKNGGPTTPSLSETEAILCSSGIGLDGSVTSGFVGIQLSDSFFSDPDAGIDETMLLNGGLQLGSTSSQLESSPSFFLGQVAGIAVKHTSEWSRRATSANAANLLNG